MILFDDFVSTARKYFDFLENDFKYVFITADTEPFIYYITYRRKNTMIRIRLAYRHDYLEAYIFQEVDKFQPNPQDCIHSVSLQDLIYKEKGRSFDHEKDYDLYMPSKIGLNDSTAKISELFKNYAVQFL